MAISASAIPGATTARLALPAAPISENALMMPMTVPNSPMKGVALPVVARKGSRASRRWYSCAEAQVMRRNTRCNASPSMGCVGLRPVYFAIFTRSAQAAR